MIKLDSELFWTLRNMLRSYGCNDCEIVARKIIKEINEFSKRSSKIKNSDVIEKPLKRK